MPQNFEDSHGVAHSQVFPNKVIPHRAQKRKSAASKPSGKHGVRLALFEPDIPQNAGALIRLGACMDVGIDIIEPCGFLWSDAALRRAGMDYLDRARVVRYTLWRDFLDSRRGRIILLTTKTTDSYTEFMFVSDDTLLVGRESAGVPVHVHDGVAARLRIPIRSGLRSLNVAQAGAMVLGEALRQTGGFPQ